MKIKNFTILQYLIILNNIQHIAGCLLKSEVYYKKISFKV